MAYGQRVNRSSYNPYRSVIADPDTSASGNLILRVGREFDADTPRWEATEHVVMTPDEAREFLARCAALLAD